MTKIKAPTDFNGVRCGVLFQNGVGETDSEHLIYWFKTHGYEVESGSSAPTKKPRTRKKTVETEG